VVTRGFFALLRSEASETLALQSAPNQLPSGLAYVEINGQYGFIDYEGFLNIAPRFLIAHSFKGQAALVLFKSETGKPVSGYIDRAGHVIWRESK
jgi:hypothetical protein